ncbi:putative manganese-dependent inorganic diphosphatase [Selenihalanaerobacter shriftii]|uniref:inorganic diphosphatase n=1 Tax=Selenihalanaerobacter shriftii TaxID=142842 RepID=A0A1T4JUR3_9FIRM|nr:putative manganese-dependent inorganic diphosphatase [Selenihalanaerobacter shriftii]SJZ33845.1 manganese-dependent inorganic pyrophosphatase [Selenihalanaerobacter shriftii]
MSKEKIVIGHQNPDTDSICSAIAYAKFKQELGEKVAAARCGGINPETKFVLDYFNVQAPELVTDVYTRVSDIMNRNNLKTVAPNTPIKEVGELLEQEEIKVVPVINEINELLGIVTAGDIAHRYLEELAVESLREVPTSLENIIHTLEGEVIIDQQDISAEVTGNIITGAMDAETMRSYISSGDIVLLGNRVKAQRVALEADISCLIVTGDLEVKTEIKDLATKKEITIIKVPHDTFAAARLINMSIPVSKVMSIEVESFYPNELVDNVREDILNSAHRSYPVIDRQNRLLGLVSARNLIDLETKEVILVDHNEKSQAVEGIAEATLLEVIDHHRLGDLETLEPILVRNEPVGSTATIVAKLYSEYGIALSEEIAGILLAAILSDTVIFRSPTCTLVDREVANNLAEIIDEDIEKIGRSIFKAGSVLNKLEPRELILNDFKEYAFNEVKIGVGQIEIMDLEEFKKQDMQILTALQKLKEEKSLNYIFLMVTDILNEGSLLLFNKQAGSLVKRSFVSEDREIGVYLTGVMSRKKQIIPILSKMLTN